MHLANKERHTIWIYSRDHSTVAGTMSLAESIKPWVVTGVAKVDVIDACRGRDSVPAQIYKQLNASFGEFAMATLKASTKALASDDAEDATYNPIEGQIQSLTGQRDSLASPMISLFDGAEFDGQTFSNAQAQSLIAQGQALLNQANSAALACERYDLLSSAGSR